MCYNKSMIQHANFFYFRRISHIGGTEQFLYEIAKKYHNYDIAVLYDETDLDQLIRLRKLVPCYRRDRAERYVCKKAFYNFNLDAIDYIEADEHIFVCHAIYQELGYRPPIDNPKIDRIIGVSDYAVSKIHEQAELQNVKKPIQRVYNPLTLEKPDKVVRIISASRLDDKTKGGQRTIKLIEALDRYCEKHGTHYLWHIYSNSHTYKVDSPNVCYMAGRADIRPFIADADYLVQVSNDMETYCYSIQEALGYGTRIVRTPLTVCKEFNIPKSAELVLDWDCSNVDEIAEKMFEPKKDFSYKAPSDGWKTLLDKKPSDYIYHEQNVRVKALKAYYDIELGQQVSAWTPAWETTLERAKKLYKKGLIRILE